MQIPLKTLFVVSLALIGSCALFGQATDGNIIGTISDASGAAVPNAAVSVANVDTGVTFTTKSDGSGEYRLPNLLVGTYNVTATAPGMQTTTVEKIAVNLNVQATVNVVLKVGSAATTVEITDAAAVIDTTTAQVTNTFSREMATELPTTSNPNGGVLNLSLLDAGVTSNGGVGVGTGPSIGGQRPRNNSFNIEGVDK